MASKSIPPPPADCGNCGAPLYGKYCHACGQPVEGLVRHFGSVLGDVVDSLFNIDARILHTLLPLYFRPGQLSLDYFAGKRARYVTPFRLVFFLAITAFLAIQLADHSSTSSLVQFQTPSIGGATSKSIAGGAPPETHFGNGNIRFNGKIVWNRESMPLHAVWLPGFANEWLNDAIEHARNNLHEMNSGNATQARSAAQRLVDGAFAVAPQVLFVLLPVFALLLEIFYIFKKRMYMEHLIVAMHSHAFLMLSVLVLVVLNLLRDVTVPHAAWLGGVLAFLHGAAWLWMLTYLFLMQKRVYRQGWLMTSLKYTGIGICYSVLIGMGMAFALLLSLGST